MADVLGTFEQAVLLAIGRLRQDAYGRAILKDVQTRLERDVAAGAVHTTLARLEHTIWVGNQADDPAIQFMRRLAMAHGGTFRMVHH